MNKHVGVALVAWSLMASLPAIGSAQSEGGRRLDNNRTNADGSKKDVVTCNAFGSYILTKNNATGSYQQGQMCTFYTAYWDAKYATNKASFDDAIGAKYNYTYSAFYGKQGAQPQGCASEFVASSGTYIKGGKNPKSA